MVKWHCDSCGKATQVNPPTEAIMEPLLDDKGKQVSDKEGKPAFRQSIGTQKVQNGQTGKVEEIKVAMFKDLLPRAYIVRLSVGQEQVQRDFCKTCLSKLMPAIKPLWDELEKVISQ